jgi:hypothetical protein
VAEKLIRQLLDDIDGSEAAFTRRFTIDGRTYRIDLSSKNNEKLDKALAPFIENATVEGGRRSSSKATASPKRDYDIAALRAWAAKHRVAVPARGRIPAATVETYKASLKK